MTTAIDGIGSVTGKTFTVYTVDGRLVGAGLKSLSGLKKGVYIINDRKVTIGK